MGEKVIGINTNADLLFLWSDIWFISMPPKMWYKRKHAPKCKLNWDDLLKLSIENLKTCQRNDNESHAHQSNLTT